MPDALPISEVSAPIDHAEKENYLQSLELYSQVIREKSSGQMSQIIFSSMAEAKIWAKRVGRAMRIPNAGRDGSVGQFSYSGITARWCDLVNTIKMGVCWELQRQVSVLETLFFCRTLLIL